jgi:mannose-6-phosphate isomerase-like protein (cupin superfamily)
MTRDDVRAAQVVLPCSELEPTLEFFTERLGFRVAAIFPADDPSTAVVTGYGVRIQLERMQDPAAMSPGMVRLLCHDPEELGDGATELVAPNGTCVQLVEADPSIIVPPFEQSFVLTKMTQGSWGKGRAGMEYRDLIPGRLGGSVIASHIRISDGGLVPDYVHFHKIKFQMIYVYKGWVRLVYEDQGPPFVMQGGDCVLQPSRIRHRVLECSPGFEVVEIAVPAQHETFGDLEMTLPTSSLRPERSFEGQRFVCHFAEKATWEPFRMEGFESRDTGIADATSGVASARVARSSGEGTKGAYRHDADLVFHFVLQGSASIHCEGEPAHRIAPGDAMVLPRQRSYSIDECSPDLGFLEVSLPATFATSVR